VFLCGFALLLCSIQAVNPAASKITAILLNILFIGKYLILFTICSDVCVLVGCAMRTCTVITASAHGRTLQSVLHVLSYCQGCLKSFGSTEILFSGSLAA
jgi:hypothetical protein